MLTIRKSTIEDLDSITDIYNDAVLNTTCTFDIKPKSIKDQEEWFRSHNSRNPLITAVYSGKIAGWASLSPVSGRCAYSESAEISVYVSGAFRRKGIGKQLIAEILRLAKEEKLHTIIARISIENKISLNMFENLGFFHAGLLKEIGFKFGRRIDVVIMQKIL